MIAGLGVDMVHVERIRLAMTRDRFIRRILTQRERDQLVPMTAERLAGRWALKEAAKKAWPAIHGWHQVEALGLETGGFALVIQGLPDGLRAIGSISHEREFAVAVAIIERVA